MYNFSVDYKTFNTSNTTNIHKWWKSKTRVASSDKRFTSSYSNHTCLVVISLDSAVNKDGKYYPQVFLNESKYVEKKVIRYIMDNLL